MVGADLVGDVDDGAGDVGGSEPADGDLPIADADHAAARGNPSDLLVAEVARVVAGAAHPAMGEDGRSRCDVEHVVHRGR